MKQTLEEAAIEGAKGYNIVGQTIYKSGFKAGAEWKEKQSPWISIDEGYPEDKQPVLCSSQIYGKVVLCWDELSQTWNYPESGEFYCEWNKVDCWMYIPEL
nr:MAG TPA: Protein of unknown function (DUF551) [Caudoviricetes sp.]